MDDFSVDIDYAAFEQELATIWQVVAGQSNRAALPTQQPTIGDLVATMEYESPEFKSAWQESRELAGQMAARYILRAEFQASNLTRKGWSLFYFLVQDFYQKKHGLTVGQAIPDPVAFFQEVFAAFTTMRKSIRSDDDSYKPRHYLAPVLKAWLEQPVLIANPHADKNGKPYYQLILPIEEHEYRLVPKEKLATVDFGGQSMGMLPGFAEYLDQCDLPHPHILLANAVGFAGLTPGKGARLDSRLLWWCLTATEFAERVGNGLYKLPYTLQDVIDLLWPSEEGLYRMGIDPTGMGFPERSSFRPGKHGQGLLNALDAVLIAKVVFPDGYFFRPITIWGGHLDVNNRRSRVEFKIELPPGADKGGAEVGRIPLLAAGTQSDTAFRLEIGLSYLWDEAKRKNRGSRVYDSVPEVLRNDQGYLVDTQGQVIVDKGKPTKSWAHPRAVHTGRVETSDLLRGRVRSLDNRGLHRLAYSEVTETYGKKASGTIRKEVQRVKGVLDKLESAGRIAIDKTRQGWRIIQRWQE